MTNLSATDWVQRYEDLRAHHLSLLPGVAYQALGLTVFLQQGMRGWIAAWQALAAPTSPAPPMPAGQPALQSVAQTTVLLANMILRQIAL